MNEHDLMRWADRINRREAARMRYRADAERKACREHLAAAKALAQTSGAFTDARTRFKGPTGLTADEALWLEPIVDEVERREAISAQIRAERTVSDYQAILENNLNRTAEIKAKHLERQKKLGDDAAHMRRVKAAQARRNRYQR